MPVITAFRNISLHLKASKTSMHNKDSILQRLLQLKPHTGLKQTALLYPNDSGNSRNDPKMVYQEQPQVASASGKNTSNKLQVRSPTGIACGDFLLTILIHMEVNNNHSIKVGNAIQSLPQFEGKVPYRHSLQHRSLVPFSIPATCYTDHLSTETATQQVQPQIPQYPSKPFCVPPYMSHSGITKQHQRLWAAHLEAQYKPGGTSTVLTQFQSRQNGRPESFTLIPYAQKVIPPFSSLDVPSPKNNIAQNQLLKMAISSYLPPTRAKSSEHNLPSMYEKMNGRIRNGGTVFAVTLL
ncbi:uncharacterized protein LOC120216779 [Hibiscus syriacus]|uniref:uncharacterized protein LOC120216779 n=1 Tax=Hibiscus syriacus TaxID=106335 RepID=UPI00192494A2|nr:uncharacterized protein LOC120216779 [Hibiscus syriacus]